MTHSQVIRFHFHLGLSPDDLSNLSKYLHLRPVQNKNKKDLIGMGRATFDFNFLDSLNEDQIKGNNT